MPQRVKVFAPATVANLGPGFDVLGLALEQPGDIVEAELKDEPGVELVEVIGDGGALSRDPAKNVVCVGAAGVLRLAGTGQGVRLWLHKQMPLGSGLGSSAASSVAGAFAVNELLGRPFSKQELLPSALEGERVACGTGHADNAAPSLFGGIVCVRSYEPLEVIQLPVPEKLWVAVVHPHCELTTGEMRQVLRDHSYDIKQAAANFGNIAALVHALHTGDLELLGRSMTDQVVEPVRRAFIPGFDAVKMTAMATGALGCSISGSGPSLFALTADEVTARRVASAMQAAFQDAAHLASESYVGQVNRQGARVVE